MIFFNQTTTDIWHENIKFNFNFFQKSHISRVLTQIVWENIYIFFPR